MSAEKITSPVGELEWVTISGKGKPNMSGKLEYKVDVVLEGEQAEALKKLIDDFWADNKPNKVKKPKSLGYYPHKVLTDEKDEDGDPIWEEDGKTAFVFKTGTTFKDGNAKTIPIYNAKGAEVSLGKKQIGNGSRGRVQGAMDIYEVKSEAGKTQSAGVSLYLNGLQLAKFVEYKGGVNFDGLDAEYGDFEGFEDDGMDAINDDENVSDTDAGDKVKI